MSRVHTLPVDEKTEAANRHRAHLQQLKKEHKQEMRALRSNTLFQEFLHKANEGRRLLAAERRREEDTQNDQSTGDVIRRTAEQQGRPLHGVWSAFGQPYAPQGVPVHVVKRLPPLHRDDINGVATEEARGAPGSAAAPALGMATLAGGPPGEGAEAERSSTAKTLEETPDTPVGGSLSMGEEAILCWAVSDEEEVRFPRDMLHLAAFRKRKAQSGRSFVNPVQASRELAYFEEEEPSEGVGGGGTIAEEPEQEPGEEDANGDEASLSRSRASSRADALSEDMAMLENIQAEVRSHHSSSGASQREGAASVAAGKKERPYSSRSAMIARTRNAAQNPPAVKPPTVPKPRVFKGMGVAGNTHGSTADADYFASSPVVRWRKEFLDVRHHMNQQLFDQLQDRAERRAVAMKSTLYTTAVANQLMEDMRLRGGKLSALPGDLCRDSWYRAQVAMHAQDQPKKVDVAEIQAIERFYEKLCHLVERQRVSDPLSLSIVHKTKALLETGHNMHKPLLLRVLEHVKSIHDLGGADNPYVMPILHFIRQSVRVTSEDFDAMLLQMHLTGLVAAHQRVSRGMVTKSPLPPTPQPAKPKPDKERSEADTESAGMQPALPNIPKSGARASSRAGSKSGSKASSEKGSENGSRVQPKLDYE